MPLFDFECRDCQAVFDELVKSPDDVTSVRCSSCGSARVERLVSVFSAPAARGGAGLPRPSPGGRPPAGGCGSGCGCHRG